ncbi:MAG TPA: DNA mismatch repair endonuclease MutL [Phycisphaerae bacterium]|nr:DNA mismatch repair endonuclease MutL [Phycisphaerae bacterium]
MNGQVIENFSAPTAPIHVLDDALVNKIAAGEVVERPASVVKELLENAVDAGATRLSITIENGGKTLIRVTDDGSGISPEDLPLAFARHATSKISSVEDLFSIQTMGFRGEALASIAGISHASIITRRSQDQQGWRINAHESVLEPAVPTSAPVGTTVEVRDLFYCVPARRKFLRSDATEFGHIQEMVLRIALAYPHIALMLSHNDRKVLDLPAASDHQVRIVEAFGGEFKNQLIPISYTDPNIQVRGFVGLPETARATTRFQYLFLNGRYIRDRSIFHALKEAYRGLIEPAAQPVGVLFLVMAPVAFDVNVHPQKTEVRFRDPNLAYRAVLAAIREQFLQRDLTPHVRLSAGGASGTDDVKTQAAQTRQIIADFFRQPQADSSKIDFPAATAGSSGSAPSSMVSQPYRAESHLQSKAFTPVPLPSVLSQQIPVQGELEPLPNHFMQFHDSYLVVQESDGILIIDQHALHERIIYEDLLARVRQGPLEAQRLLLPVVVSVAAGQLAIFERVKPLLVNLGIDVDVFDSGSVAVQSLPTLLARLNPTQFIRELLDKLLETSGRITDEELLHEVLDMAACKAAIKAGDPLTPDEIQALLRRREEVERSSNCPHGRPTTVRMSLRDLERQFKRR